MSIHKNLEFYRKQSGMTRKALAEGICDESTIYRIEKGTQTPRLDLLRDICRKLMVSIDFVISDLHYNELMEIEIYKDLCRELTYRREYELLALTIEQFEKLINTYKHQFEYSNLKRFITWHKSILLHMKEKNVVKAEIELESIYKQRLLNEMDIGICNSLGLVKLVNNDVQTAFPYFKDAYSAVKKIPFTNDLTLAPRVAYNLAYCHYYLGELDEAKILACKTLDILKKKQLIFGMGRTKHMLGMIYKKKLNYERSREYLWEAKCLFQLEKDDVNYRKAQKDLAEVESLIKEYDKRDRFPIT